jgi:hypothetical protein
MIQKVIMQQTNSSILNEIEWFECSQLSEELQNMIGCKIKKVDL